jgi:hypothetical protein
MPEKLRVGDAVITSADVVVGGTFIASGSSGTVLREPTKRLAPLIEFELRSKATVGEVPVRLLKLVCGSGRMARPHGLSAILLAVRSLQRSRPTRRVIE